MRFWVIACTPDDGKARVSSLAFESLEEAEAWVMKRGDCPEKSKKTFVYQGRIYKYELFEVGVH